jgi:hypothetical protein
MKAGRPVLSRAMLRALASLAALSLVSACVGFELWQPTSPETRALVQAESEPPRSSSNEPWSGHGWWPGYNSLRGDEYELDAVDRFVSGGAKVRCDQSHMVRYSGTTLRYAAPVLVHPSFRERLQRFEQVAASVARDVYGREPKLVRHYGAFSCRATRNRPELLSEHALGNALDLVGFDFGPARSATPLPAELPRALRGAFQVSVRKHWGASAGVNAVHARFLAELTRRLDQRSDVFRSMFGPGHGGHDDHLHLDAAPWRYVDL